MYVFSFVVWRVGEKIDGPRLESLLDETEGWMWDNAEASLGEVQAKVELCLACDLTRVVVLI